MKIYDGSDGAAPSTVFDLDEMKTITVLGDLAGGTVDVELSPNGGDNWVKSGFEFNGPGIQNIDVQVVSVTPIKGRLVTRNQIAADANITAIVGAIAPA